MKYCKNCKTEHSDFPTYCIKCGKKLINKKKVNSCSCGAMIYVPAIFCWYCGKKINNN